MPRWKPRAVPAALGHRRVFLPAFSPSALISLCAVFAVVALFCVPGGVSLDTVEPGGRQVLVIVGEPPAETTVFQRIEIMGPLDGNRSLQVGVPVQAGHHEVTDPESRALGWSQTGPGVLHVAIHAETRVIEVTSRALTGPGDGQPLRFGHADPAEPLWLVIGVPPSLEAGAFGLGATTKEQLRATDVVPDHWPLPDEWMYVWNEGRDHALPETIEPAARELRPALSPYALGVAAASLLGVMTLWLIMRIHKGLGDPTRTRKQPVMKHLEELRKRLAVVAAVLVLATGLFFSFGFRWIPVAGTLLPLPVPSLHANAASQVFAWLSKRIVPAGVEVVVVAPFDAVMTLLLLSFALSVLVTFPVVVYHTYAFLAPALFPHERRLVLLASPAVVVLFGTGALFGLLLMAPLIVMVLYGFAAAAGATAFLTMPQLVSIAALLSLLFGIAFQMPLVMMLTARMGLVRAASYRRQWRWAVIIIVIVSAMVTDPTVVTQIIVALVLMGLYAIGLVLAWMADRRRTAPDE